LILNVTGGGVKVRWQSWRSHRQQRSEAAKREKRLYPLSLFTYYAEPRNFEDAAKHGFYRSTLYAPLH
jgi:hypothetical protein